MKNLLIHYLILVCIQQNVFAEDKIPVGARPASLGLCSVSLNDFWSVINNQAIMADVNQISTGIYFENRFMQKELSLKAIGLMIPTRYGVLGINHSHWGYTSFNEQKTGLGYSRKICYFLNAGVQLDYISQNISESYGSSATGTFEAGIYGKLNKKLFLGAHLFNPLQNKIPNSNSEIARLTYRFGFTYLVTAKVTTLIEVEKELRFNPSFRGGMEYRFQDRASVRVGFSTIPAASGSNTSFTSSMITFGFGTVIGKFRIDMGSSFHTMLGSSFQFSTIYIFKQQ